jgi:hypothetical protein
MTNLELAQQQGNQAAPNLLAAATAGELGGGSFIKPTLGNKTACILGQTVERTELDTIKNNFAKVVGRDPHVILVTGIQGGFLYIDAETLDICKNNVLSQVEVIQLYDEETIDSFSALKDLIIDSEPGWTEFPEDDVLEFAACLALAYFNILLSSSMVGSSLLRDMFLDGEANMLTNAGGLYLVEIAPIGSSPTCLIAGFAKSYIAEPHVLNNPVLLQSSVMPPMQISAVNDINNQNVSTPWDKIYIEDIKNGCTIDVSIETEVGTGNKIVVTGSPSVDCDIAREMREMLESIDVEAFEIIIEAGTSANTLVNRFNNFANNDVTFPMFEITSENSLKFIVWPTMENPGRSSYHATLGSVSYVQNAIDIFTDSVG